MKECSDKDSKIAIKIKEAIAAGRYRFTQHALDQMKVRKVISSEVTHVLKNGYCESSKDSYDVKSKNWKYAIRGNTIDGRDIRIIVAMRFNMMIITVIDKDH